MEFTELIQDNGLILIPVIWIIGQFLKETPLIKNWLIPYILLVIGVLLSCLTWGWNSTGITQGILITGVAVLGHQLVKQACNRDRG
ncbi:MAG TPA: phage holin family protein [Clostridia bacterium]|nr:phage holin family protein [Clostridia bacterium]